MIYNKADVVSVTVVKAAEELERRNGEGTSGNCNQVYDEKVCWCGGAISGRNNVWDGFVDACGDAAGKTLEGKGEHYWERIINPTKKIDYYVRNLCDEPVTIDEDDCRGKFEGLINWCEWTWDSHKGGYWDHECLSWVYDTNSR